MLVQISTSRMLKLSLGGRGAILTGKAKVVLFTCSFLGNN
jgi:hypothetical protein